MPCGPACVRDGHARIDSCILLLDPSAALLLLKGSLY